MRWQWQNREGKSWKEFSLGYTKVVIKSSDMNMIYAQTAETENGIWKSENRDGLPQRKLIGKTWMSAMVQSKCKKSLSNNTLHIQLTWKLRICTKTLESKIFISLGIKTFIKWILPFMLLSFSNSANLILSSSALSLQSLAMEFSEVIGC